MDQARQWLRAASSIAVLTGAGISAESGIPTFRGSGGLWKQHKPEDLATPQAFAKDPRLVWEWYDWRRTLIAQCEPNAAHRALVQLEEAKPGFTLITQNVDGLHDRAGSRRPLKLHGDIWRLQCSECGRNWPDRRTPLPKLPPHCGCGAIARPGVVWFGGHLDPGIVQACANATTCDVFMTVGTSSLVYPAASLVEEARQRGAWTVEVNLESTPASGLVDVALQGPAEKILAELEQRLAQ